MDFKSLSQFVELGIAGVAVVGLMVLLWFIMRGHKDERTEWRKDAQERHRETTQVLKELTTVIDAINRSDRR